MYYTPYFFLHNLHHPLTALCQQEARASISILYQFEFCTCSHFCIS